MMDCTLNDFNENDMIDYLAFTPNNVISHVFNYLTKPSDLYHAMSTCRRWKELALDPQLWSEARKAQWNEIEGLQEPTSSPLRMLLDKFVSERPEPPPPIGGHSSIFYKGKIYYLAGAGDRLFSKRIYCFDTETMKWACKAPVVGGVDGPLTYHHSSNLIENTVYIWGGVNFSDTVFALNLDTMTWAQHQPTGDLPSNRHHHCAVAIDKKIWVMGGQTSNHSALISLDHVSILDTETMIWSKLGLRANKAGLFPSPMRGCSALLMGRKIFVFGGLDEKRSKAELWELNIDTLTWNWIQFPTAPKERYAHASAVISNEEFICYGGYDGSHDLDNLTVFNIKTGRWWDPIPWGEKSPHYRTATTITWIGDRAIVFGGLFYVDTKIQSFNDVHSLILRGPKLNGH